jgi:hypothetical protein
LLDGALLGARRGLIRLRAALRSTARCSALDVGLFDLRAARRSTTRCSALDVDLFDCALLGCDVGRKRLYKHSQYHDVFRVRRV